MREFQEAVASFDIAHWLGIHASTRASGYDNLTVNPCPICGSTAGKFYVNVSVGPKRGLWQSHCCHDQGNLVGLVAMVEAIGPLEAKAMIRVESGERLFHQAEAPQEAPIGRAQGLPEPNWRADPNFHIVHRGELVRLVDRLVTDQAVTKYDLRITTGHSHTSYAGEERRDLQHRLVVPINAPDGALLSWQARDLTGQARNKYVFPAGASATDTMFGWTLKPKHGDILIVEGFFHRLAWDRLGPTIGDNTFVSFGKKLTEAQIALLVSCQADSVTLGWDLDAIPQMCQYALKLRGRKKVYILPPLSPNAKGARDHDEAHPDELAVLLTQKVEATPGLIAELSARAALGEFKPRR